MKDAWIIFFHTVRTSVRTYRFNMDIRRRLVLVLIAIFIVIMIGSNGYFILYRGKEGFIDCMYMTVISLTGVGYGEVIEVSGNVASQVFTMVLITFGMGIIFYGISTLTALMIEGELSGILRKKQMVKRIKKLKNHYIVCGGGETGRPLVTELRKNMETVVLIEISEEKIELCKEVEDILHIKGDATEDGNLIVAGVENAAGIIICLPSDKDNLYITMTARMLNKNIRIISRMIDPNHYEKFRRVGADSVVSPNLIGALRMASEMIRPTVVDFLDNMLRIKDATLRISEIKIPKNSSVAGKSIMESGVKNKFNLLILGSKKDRGDILFNPPSSHVLAEEMTLIVMGDVANIEKAKRML